MSENEYKNKPDGEGKEGNDEGIKKEAYEYKSDYTREFDAKQDKPDEQRDISSSWKERSQGAGREEDCGYRNVYKSNSPRGYYRSGDGYQKESMDIGVRGYSGPVESQYKQRHDQDDQRKGADRGFKIFLGISGVLALIVVAVMSSLVLISVKDGKLAFLSEQKDPSSTVVGVNPDGPTLDTKDHTETEGAMTAELVYKKSAPSVVGVLTYNPSAGLISSSAAQGSGIIMSKDGYVITNAHVIGNTNKNKITVVLSQGEECQGSIVGYDTRTDIAVLKINAKAELTPAEFGNSDQLAVGSWVLALGNPGGLEFSNSLTRGIVSAINRSVGSTNSLVKYIQTDAPINPGNSGGMLANMYGQVIGVNTAKITDYEGMGFAIPINTVKTVVDDIIKKGYVSGRVRMGVTVRPLSAYEAQVNGVPQGLLVMDINKDSEAFTNGLSVNDIITKIDGTTTIATAALYNELSKHKPGDIVTLTLYRLASKAAQWTTVDIQVTLIEDKGEAVQ